jgi:hypothetical protein
MLAICLPIIARTQVGSYVHNYLHIVHNANDTLDDPTPTQHNTAQHSTGRQATHCYQVPAEAPSFKIKMGLGRHMPNCTQHRWSHLSITCSVSMHAHLSSVPTTPPRSTYLASPLCPITPACPYISFGRCLLASIHHRSSQRHDPSTQRIAPYIMSCAR